MSIPHVMPVPCYNKQTSLYVNLMILNTCVFYIMSTSASQYSASVLDVNATMFGESMPVVIRNVAWETGGSFTGSVDGVAINGVDSNGHIAATGYYCGTKYSATGIVTGWQ